MLNQLKHILYAAIWLLWGMASFSYLVWFFGHLSLHFDLLHALLLLAVAFFWVKRSRWQWPASLEFYRNPYALVLGLASLSLLIILRTQSPIRLFGFVAALFLAYSLAGLVVSPHRWKKSLIPFSLLVMTLPFGRHLDVFVGYPLRILSVQAAHQALAPVLPDLSSVSSLLIIENRASQVDMDCSGLKGVWVGLLLYFVISWLENCRTGLRWLLGVFAFLAYLVGGNLLRVVLLSLVHLHWQQEALDPWVHHSTAVFFLVTGVGLCYWYLRYKTPKRAETSAEPALKLTAPLRFQMAVAILMLIPVTVPEFGNTHLAKATSPVAEAALRQGWKRIDLSAAEKEVYRREGVEGHKFEKGENQLILVLNGDWRSQHKPELCYELSGLPLAGMHTLLLRPGFPVRQLKFKDRHEQAFFWFQSGEEVTEDFATKVWNQLKGGSREWTLVSLLNHNGQLPEEEMLNIQRLIANPN